MTNQEAITKLTNVLNDDHYAWHPSILEAFRMAVDALRGLPSAHPTHGNASNALKSLDCIDRQAAIDEIRKCRFVVDAIEKIRGLPSAQPEKRTEKRTETHACDLIDRQAAIDTLAEYIYNVDKVMGTGKLSAYDCKDAAKSVLDELPSFPQAHENDCISRKAAIDIERNATVDTNPSHFEAHQKFMQFMDDAEISSFGRWQWSNGFNTALTAVGIDLKKLPPAQPELANKSAKLDNDFGESISRQAAIDICNNAIDLWHGQLGEGALVAVKKGIEGLPSSQLVCEDAVGRQRVNKIVDMILYDDIRADEIIREIDKLPSAQPEQRWIPCGKCIHADGKHRWCKVLDRTINEDDFCCWAEPRKEGEAE